MTENPNVQINKRISIKPRVAKTITQCMQQLRSCEVDSRSLPTDKVSQLLISFTETSKYTVTLFGNTSSIQIDTFLGKTTVLLQLFDSIFSSVRGLYILATPCHAMIPIFLFFFIATRF
jgi:hypothetical protein